MIAQKNWFKGTWISTLSLVAALLTATAAFAADTKGLVALTLQGVGTFEFVNLPPNDCQATDSSPAIICREGDFCACVAVTETIVGNQGFSGGSLTLKVLEDQSPNTLPMADAGFCLPATGFGTISSSDGRNTISIDVSGLVCRTFDGSADTFNGTYIVTGGSKFAHGTGALNSSVVGTEARISLSGNIQP